METIQAKMPLKIISPVPFHVNYINVIDPEFPCQELLYLKLIDYSGLLART